MNSLCIKKYEENLWKKALLVEMKKLVKLESSVKNDPVTSLIKIHVEFNEMLKSGRDRTSKKFMDEISELSRKEKIEQKRRKTFDFIKEHDKECEQRILVGNINQKLAMISFYAKKQ